MDSKIKKKEIKNISEQEKKPEDLDKIVNLVETILEFNRQQIKKGK